MPAQRVSMRNTREILSASVGCRVHPATDRAQLRGGGAHRARRAGTGQGRQPELYLGAQSFSTPSTPCA